MSLCARCRTVAHTALAQFSGGKVSMAAPAPALGAGEQMQIELVPAWPPAHCSAMKTDRRVLHAGAGGAAAPACPSRENCEGKKRLLSVPFRLVDQRVVNGER